MTWPKSTPVRWSKRARYSRSKALTSISKIDESRPRSSPRWIEIQAAYLRRQLASIDTVELPWSGPIYNEFTVRTPRPATDVLLELADKKILGGIALDQFWPDMKNDFLVAVTELNTREQMDQYADALSDILPKGRR